MHNVQMNDAQCVQKKKKNKPQFWWHRDGHKTTILHILRVSVNLIANTIYLNVLKIFLGWISTENRMYVLATVCIPFIKLQYWNCTNKSHLRLNKSDTCENCIILILRKSQRRVMHFQMICAQIEWLIFKIYNIFDALNTEHGNGFSICNEWGLLIKLFPIHSNWMGWPMLNNVFY